MRPIVLTMTAFGPFAEKTVIDFRKLDRGVYLITGDTGAGKTSIFDAIVFALYGEGSGTGRSSEMFHSDYVDKFTDTEVELVFSGNGKEYRVVRTIHYQKKRSGGVGAMTKQAVFYEQEALPIEKETAVNERVTEVIGLDEKQFRQIVMLAQGEFRKFLESKSDAREQILGKLFDNRSFSEFQERFKDGTEALRKQREEKEREIGFCLKDGSTVEMLEQTVKECEESKKTLERQIEAESRRLEEQQKKCRTLTVYLEKTAENTKLSGDLENISQKLEELEALKKKLEEQYTDCEKTIPLIDERKLQIQEMEKNEAAFETSRKHYFSAQKKLEEKQKEYLMLQGVYETSMKEFMETNRLFLAGQAGILAGELSKSLEQNKEAVCPVCGHHVTEADRAHFGTRTAAVPSQEEVERARLAAEEKREAAMNCAKDCEVWKNTLTLTGKQLLETAQQLFRAEIVWEELLQTEQCQSRQKEVQEKKEWCKKETAALEAALEKARRDLKSCGESVSNLKGQQKMLKLQQKTLEQAVQTILIAEPWLSEITDAEALRKETEEAFRAGSSRKKELEQSRENVLYRLQNGQDALQRIARLQKELRETEAAYQKLWKLSSLANGQSGEGGKYSFSRYVMGAFFEEILDRANQHLDAMTGGNYELLRKQEADRKNESAGLGMMIYDAYTGETRDTASLSGGESFQVSLALALGLSDVVREHSGGFTLDAMFIDEGFGSLDEQALEQAMGVLRELSGDSRQIGIISHVGRLSEIISRKICVTRSPKGSRVEILA